MYYEFLALRFERDTRGVMSCMKFDGRVHGGNPDLTLSGISDAASDVDVLAERTE
jgi:hypothetical protein